MEQVCDWLDNCFDKLAQVIQHGVSCVYRISRATNHIIFHVLPHLIRDNNIILVLKFVWIERFPLYNT